MNRRWNKGLVKVAGVMALGVAGAVALGFQMTDVGHFSGFMLAAVTFAVAALYILWQGAKLWTRLLKSSDYWPRSSRPHSELRLVPWALPDQLNQI